MNRIENIGSMIREERLKCGMTQEQLGSLVGVGKAQISKIEGGNSLTIKTVTKVMNALGKKASVTIQNSSNTTKNTVGYIVAVINEFANMHGLSAQEASNYLIRFKGIDFLTNHYEAEHLLSIDDTVSDITKICFNNGGGII